MTSFELPITNYQLPGTSYFVIGPWYFVLRNWYFVTGLRAPALKSRNRTSRKPGDKWIVATALHLVDAEALHLLGCGNIWWCEEDAVLVTHRTVLATVRTILFGATTLCVFFQRKATALTIFVLRHYGPQASQ